MCAIILAVVWYSQYFSVGRNQVVGSALLAMGEYVLMHVFLSLFEWPKPWKECMQCMKSVQLLSTLCLLSPILSLVVEEWRILIERNKTNHWLVCTGLTGQSWGEAWGPAQPQDTSQRQCLVEQHHSLSTQDHMGTLLWQSLYPGSYHTPMIPGKQDTVILARILKW